MKNTTEQQKASNPEHSVWVTANAGTGKTKILTDRFLRLVLSGTPPAKILCITYTNAAAAEMEERIKNELKSWAVIDEKSLIEKITALNGFAPDTKTLKKARTIFAEIIDDSASLKIQTIHAFCQSILKKFPLEAKIPPHFQVVDERTAQELVQEAWLRIISGEKLLTKEQDEKVKAAIDNLSSDISDSTLSSVVIQLVNSRLKFSNLISRNGGTDKLINSVYEWLGADKNSDERKVLFGACADKNIDINGLRILSEALKSGKKAEHIERGEIISAWLESNPESRARKIRSYIKIFLTADGDAKKPGSIIIKELAKKFPEAGKVISREQERLIKLDDQIKTIRTAKFTEHIINISEAVIVIYTHLKERHAFLDYAGLIENTAKLLNDSDAAPWVMYKLDDRIDHIMLDEAQDTSPEQWSIIEALCNEFFAGEGKRDINRTLFVVGDEKQSIFSFQGADPLVFDKKRSHIKTSFSNSRKSWEDISLIKSFRSTNEVLKLVDNVFKNEENLKSITRMQETINHIAHRENHSGKVELWPVITDETEKNEESWPLPIKMKKAHDTGTMLASKIAENIRLWLDEGKIIPSRNRAIKEEDIMILVRRRGSLVEKIIAALQKKNINVAGIDRIKLNEHIAVMDLLALGNFLMLPEDDLNLANLLKSPLIGMNEDAIFELAYNRGEKSIWQRLRESPYQQKPYEYLSNLLSMADFLSPSRFYSHVLEVTSGRSAFISRLGHEVNDILDEFINTTITYEQSHTHSMQGFLHWMERGESEVKRDSEQGKNEVRIMTVHAAKGLQAPIVFLADSADSPIDREKIIWPDDADILLWPGSVSNLNQKAAAIREQAQNTAYDEYIRLLYVALTRAEDELYITGIKPYKNYEKSWHRIIRDSMSGIATKTDDDRLIIGDGGGNSKATAETEEKKTPAPKYLFTAARTEKERTPVSPSEFAKDISAPSPVSDINLYRRGKLIHLLLQILPDIPKEKRLKTADEILLKNGCNEKSERDEMINQTLGVLDNPDFAYIFGENSMAEIAVSGMVGDIPVSGQIDRLVIGESEVTIIDYKTNEKWPESEDKIPNSYIKQLALYKSLIERIYPEKTVKCALLWTAKPILMQLNIPATLDLEAINT